VATRAPFAVIETHRCASRRTGRTVAFHAFHISVLAAQGKARCRVVEGLHRAFPPSGFDMAALAGGSRLSRGELTTMWIAMAIGTLPES
jgi:hypothetical protein